MADAQVLGACTVRCRGSTPLSCITFTLGGIEMKKHILTSRAVKAFVIAGATLLPLAGAWADTIYVQTGTDLKGLEFPGVAITDIKPETVKLRDVESADAIKNKGLNADDSVQADVLHYTTTNGDPKSKPLDKILQIVCDSEPALTKAEAEYVKKDFAGAAGDYRKALSSSSKDWVKRRADVRLLSISTTLGDFLGTVNGFVELARKDPVSAPSHKPSVTGAKPEQIDSAIATVVKAKSQAKSSVQAVLLPFLAELYNAKGDSENATKALEENAKLQAGNSGTANANPSGEPSSAALAAKSAEAEVALSSATKALDARQYDQVIKTITDSSKSFIDPDRQAKALYLLAEAKLGSANTPDAYLDAGVAYGRVVAFFKNLPTPRRATPFTKWA